MKLSRSMQLAAFAAAVMLVAAQPSLAAQSNNARNTSVNVNPVLSITDEIGNFKLEFDSNTGTEKNSVSTGQTVTYTVKGNNMPNAALAGVVSAKISAVLDGIDVKGDPGDYVNNGTVGNVILKESAADFIKITDVATDMYKKDATDGNQGKVLNGLCAIHYRAFATRDLSDSDGGDVTLTVTLKDA